ncbi:MAG: hypothetical protein KKG47_12815 [Proteobacteria bacterium]|nr:hypothetical protein [Pseudomonadota bacterium]MBU1738734.1 hypothetical protein [Pseudomonadota bacterium]
MASQNKKDDLDNYIPAPEEELFYEQTIRRLRTEVDKGKTYAQACKSVREIDTDLHSEIVDDFLKILIAERHFGEGYGIDDIALLLDVSYDKIEAVRDYMLREISNNLSREKGWPNSKLIH